MSATTRWNIAVSPETDQSLRLFLATQGRARKGEMSRFIEEAVREKIFERSAAQAKVATGAVGEEQLSEIVAEAVQWAKDH
jgi:hypothetical protein